MNRLFTMAFHIPGTLAADAAIKFVMPVNAQLIHVQSVATNDSDATLKVGTSADDDGYIAAHTIGDSSVPTEKEAITDFAGALAGSQYPHITDGTIVVLTLDHDGAGGTAAQNVTIVLTFTEG